MPSLIIAGGRDWEPKPNDRKLVELLIFTYDIDEIVSGHCPTGTDAWGEALASDLCLKLTTFPADWSMGRKAGPIRNRAMAQYADYCILFKGGRGTASMKREAIRAQVPILYEEV